MSTTKTKLPARTRAPKPPITRSPQHVRRMVEGRAVFLAIKQARAFDAELRTLSTRAGLADFLRKARGPSASAQRTVTIIQGGAGFATIFQGGKNSGMAVVVTDTLGRCSAWVKGMDGALRRQEKRSAAEVAILQAAGVEVEGYVKIWRKGQENAAMSGTDRAHTAPASQEGGNV
jgi:hypothetical protein